jgi:hypothetical protein
MRRPAINAPAALPAALRRAAARPLANARPTMKITLGPGTRMRSTVAAATPRN